MYTCSLLHHWRVALVLYTASSDCGFLMFRLCFAAVPQKETMQWSYVYCYSLQLWPFGLSTFLASNTSFLGLMMSLPVLSDLRLTFEVAVFVSTKNMLSPIAHNFVPVCQGAMCTQ